MRLCRWQQQGAARLCVADRKCRDGVDGDLDAVGADVNCGIDRRSLLFAGGAAALVPLLPAWAQPISSGLPTVGGADLRLTIAHQMLQVDGRERDRKSTRTNSSH